jgi:hypothetical protein
MFVVLVDILVQDLYVNQDYAMVINTYVVFQLDKAVVLRDQLQTNFI